MVVVYCFSRSLYGQIKPSLCSLLTIAKPDKVYLMIKDDRIPGLDLPENVEIIQVDAAKWFRRDCPNIQPLFTDMALMKQTVSKYVQEPKCIILDPDTIICQPLDEMWNTDIEGKWFAAVPEWTGNQHAYGPIYYNAGVMLLNLEQIRRDGFADRVIELLNRKKFWLTEQDAMNELREDKHVILPVKFNECFCCGSTTDPAIVHYAGRPDWYTNRHMFRRNYLDQWIGKEFPTPPARDP